MGFARDLTPDEAALGFELAQHITHGTVVVARIGQGLRAIKMVSDAGAVRYEVCDEHGIILYPAAPSLFDLRHRFGLGDRRVG